jgi:glycerate kinase
VRRLEAGLRHLARLAEAAALLPGAGAAGGAGFGLVAFCGATLQPGADVILDAIGFEERCRRADLLLTGEGRLDVQTLWGKAVMAVARRAGRLGVPVVAIVGSCGDGAEASLAPRGPLAAVVSLAARYGIERAMREPAALLEEAAAGVVGGG